MVGANGRKITYGIKHFIVDKVEDLSKLKGYVLKPGCTAYITGSSKTYMLNNKFKWVEVKNLGSGGSGGNTPGDDDYDGGSIDGTDPDDSINGGGPEDEEYDGGSIDGTDPT